MRPKAAARASASAAPSAAPSGVTVEDVGDVDSFGRNVKFIGLGQIPTVFLDTDCASVPLGEGQRCVQVTPGTTATFNERDLTAIRLPAGATNSLICHSVTPLTFYSFRNDGSDPATAQFRLTASVTIESDALNDPRAIDPGTGLPYAGRIESGLALIFDRTTLAPGASQTRRDIATRHCIAGILSRRNLIEGNALPTDLVDRLFAEPITLRFHVSGLAENATASILFGFRLYGDGALDTGKGKGKGKEKERD